MNEPPDCTEGCAEDCQGHKWEIEPHPYSDEFDLFVTDDDESAKLVIMDAAERAWDGCEIGKEMILKIRKLR